MYSECFTNVEYGNPQAGKWFRVICVAPTLVTYGDDAGQAGNALEHASSGSSRMRKFPIPSSPLENTTETPRRPSFKNSRSHLQDEMRWDEIRWDEMTLSYCVIYVRYVDMYIWIYRGSSSNYYNYYQNTHIHANRRLLIYLFSPLPIVRVSIKHSGLHISIRQWMHQRGILFCRNVCQIRQKSFVGRFVGI